MTDKTGVVMFLSLFFMAIGTIIHLHSIPGISLETGDIPAPDINTIGGEPVNLVCGHGLSGGKISVTGLAANLCHVHVGYVGKIHALRLAEIGKPGYLLGGGYILG